MPAQVVTKGVHLLLILCRNPLDLSTHWYMCQNYVMQSLSGLIHFGFLRSSPYSSLPYSLSNVLQSLKYSHLTISLTFSKDKACFQPFHITTCRYY